MSLSHCKSFVLTMLLVLFVGGVVIAKKPPKDPPPEPDPVLVEYHLTWIDLDEDLQEYHHTLQVWDFNNSGVVVGSVTFDTSTGIGRYGYRGTAQSGLEILDDLTDDWFDLCTNLPVTGWTTVGARGVNESGQIVGYAEKEDEYQRPFVYTDGIGFCLLPSPEGARDCLARDITEEGDVLGDFLVGNTDGSGLFFWTALSPSVVTSFLPGYRVPHECGMSGSYFTAVQQDGYEIVGPLKSFSYNVDSGGVFHFQLDADIMEKTSNTGWCTITASNLVPIKEYVSEKVRGRWTRSYFVSIYDVLTQQTHRIDETLASIPNSIGNANFSGDITYKSEDELPRLYRHAEDKTYFIYDLLDDAAKTELFYDASTPKWTHAFGHSSSYINNSNVASVPGDDPFDHIVGKFYDGQQGRLFILTPVELP